MEKNANDPGELRVITDTMPVAAVRCARDSRFTWVNHTYAKWAARAAKDIVGLRIGDIMGARAMREIQPFIERILAGEPVQYERVVELPGLATTRAEALPPASGKREKARGTVAAA
jgi:PAS domain-containing protein